ncbi:F-box/LRR-repeat protein-like protein [Tanacetum coccineum]
MSENIPFDIQIEIIKKVPDVKSLLRFRSVSKQWKSLIDSSDFIASYGSRHTQPHRLLLRYQLTGYISRIAVAYDCFIDDVSSPLKEGSSPYVPRRVYKLNYSTVIGSSCGLWSFHDYIKERVAIWNPSISKLVRVVVPNNTSHKITHFGFGVCPSTYDPTIVGISYSPYVNVKNIERDKWQVLIFTLSSKTWKMIPTSNLPRESVKLMRSTQVAIDRFIFFGAYDRIVANNDVVLKNLILSFDLITHEFKEIHLPPSLANQLSQKFSISKLRESLVVSAYTNDEVNDGRVYGVWMMGEEAGVMTSFTKLFNIKIPDSSSTMTLLGFRKSGQPIMETGKKDQDFAEEFAQVNAEDFGGFDEAKEFAESVEFCDGGAEEFGALEVYEPCSEQINDLGIKGEQGSLFMSPYKETLLLADHSNGCIISNDY